MFKKLGNLAGIVVLIAAAIFFLVGCETINNKMPWQNVDGKIDAYAEMRYRKAILYMEESRFELAQEQFAIVAATANSPRLKKLGLDGYSKADIAIAVKR